MSGFVSDGSGPARIAPRVGEVSAARPAFGAPSGAKAEARVINVVHNDSKWSLVSESFVAFGLPLLRAAAVEVCLRGPLLERGNILRNV